jgi:DNA-binding winged helix-turn-helix (wHTH) protein/tetratricopeptide (TPR) repeat protein
MPSRKDRTQALAARSRFWMDDLHVQPDRCVVMRDKQEIKLELRLMEVLVMLAEHAGETITKERLLVDVWGSEVYGDSPVNKVISLLRDLIGDNPKNSRYIETVNKVGFRMIATVTLPEDYRRMPPSPWKEGSPYVGLSAYDAKHSSVFCGRGRSISDLLRAMRSQMENERRFVMIVGASGCGKTSLLRAGAIPLLTKADGFEGLRALSVADCDLAAAHGGDPLTPLVAALATWTLGNDPVFPPQTIEQLKSQLCDSPHKIAGLVADRLRRHTECNLEEEPYAHLLLTIDHAETLVASADIDQDTREAFEHLLLALCDCPHVLVTMITRSDFYPKLTETLPSLAERKAGDGHLDILPPRPGEISEIIRTPAWKANLSFEMDPESSNRLDDVLRDAAIAQPDALPLLQHTLETLYELRNDRRKLSFTAYNEIGGLEGAIAHRAEQIFAMLPAKAQKSLDSVLMKLIVIQPDSNAVSARRADVETLDVDARTLIDAFASPNARLFVRDLHNGHPTVSVVHEALLRRWPRAMEWTQENRRLLSAKAHFQRAAARWAQEGYQDDNLLNPGRPISEAQEVFKKFPNELDRNAILFLRKSERSFRRKRNVKRTAIAALTILATISSASTYVAWRSMNEVKASLQSLAKQAGAFRSISELVVKDSNMSRAKPAFETIVSTLESAKIKSPDSEDIVFQYGIANYWLGNILLNQGDLAGARTKWAIYLESCEKLNFLSPENSLWKKELSYALNNIGSIDLKDGKIEQALRNFNKSIYIKTRLLESSPEDQGLIVEYADTLSWIGSTEESIARLRSAETHYRKQIELLRNHAKDNNATDDHNRQYGNSLWRAARLSVAVGDISTAKKYISESILILEELTNSQSADDSIKKDFANSLLEAARIHRIAGSEDTAREKIEEAVRTIESISMSHQSPPAWIRLRETIFFWHAYMSNAENKEWRMQTSIDNLENLRIAHPKQRQIVIDIASIRIARGMMMSDKKRKSEATEDWRAAVNLIDSIAEESRDQVIPPLSAAAKSGATRHVPTSALA